MRSEYLEAKRKAKTEHIKRTLPVVVIAIRFLLLGLLILAVAKGCTWMAEQASNCQSFYSR